MANRKIMDEILPVLTYLEALRDALEQSFSVRLALYDCSGLPLLESGAAQPPLDCSEINAYCESLRPVLLWEEAGRRVLAVPFSTGNGAACWVAVPDSAAVSNGATLLLMENLRNLLGAVSTGFVQQLALLQKAEGVSGGRIPMQVPADIASASKVGFCLTDLRTGETLLQDDSHGILELIAPAGPQPLGGPPAVFEQYIPGQEIWLRVTCFAAQWEPGQTVRLLLYTDITWEKQARKQLEQLAYLDADLRLPNGAKLVRDVREYQSCGRENAYLVCFDIRSLRKINDIYGRETGDELLRAVRDWIFGLSLSQCSLYRIGGDEFCLLLRESSFQEVKEIADRLSVRGEEPWTIELDGGKRQLFCNMTIGILDAAQIGGSGLLNLIERVLDVSRERGAVAVYDAEMDGDFQARIKREWSLRQCVKNGMEGFDVHYQPIIDPVSGRWCSLEALCRWTSPEVGTVPPYLFISDAEKLGLIGSIGLWVLETAVRHCKRLGLDQVKDFALDVNLSPAQLLEEGTVERVKAILEKYDYPVACLSLEITESMQFNFQTGQGVEVIRQLQELGILMALDDFGTGYASFDNLKKLPAGRLKTERAFLRDIENDPYLQFLLVSMANLAHAADMKLVAEGVETPSQLRILMQSGADYLQGYLFSKPIPVAELEQKLEMFWQAEDAFTQASISRLNLQQLLDAKKGYFLSPRMYGIFHRCVQVLVNPDRTLEQILSGVLEILGDSLQLSKVILLEAEQAHLRMELEWSRQDSGCKGSCGYLELDWLETEWRSALYEDGMLAMTNAAEMSGGIHRFCPNAKSLLFMPVWERKELRGMLVLCDCRSGRDWQPEEALLLNDLSLLLSDKLRGKNKSGSISAV